MTATVLRVPAAHTDARTGPSVPRRTLAFVIMLVEVWLEMQDMRRAAQRRYPHLEL